MGLLVGCVGSPAAQEFQQETASEKTQKEVQEDGSINAKVITPQRSRLFLQGGLRAGIPDFAIKEWEMCRLQLSSRSEPARYRCECLKTL